MSSLPPQSPPALVLIAAVAKNGVIGRGNELPWRLKSDFRHFRALTMGKPVLMGRNTFLSIGRPLSGRTNIVISRDPSFAAAGVVVAGSLEAALQAAKGDALRRGAAEVMVIGGAEIYAQTLPLADRLEITEVQAEAAGDASFPAIDLSMWREAARIPQSQAEGDDAPMMFVTYMNASAG